MNRLSVIVALVQMVWRVIINVDRDIIHPFVVKWREDQNTAQLLFLRRLIRILGRHNRICDLGDI